VSKAGGSPLKNLFDAVSGVRGAGSGFGAGADGSGGGGGNLAIAPLRMDVPNTPNVPAGQVPGVPQSPVPMPPPVVNDFRPVVAPMPAIPSESTLPPGVRRGLAALFGAA
jgi:hypothetical protein